MIIQADSHNSEIGTDTVCSALSNLLRYPDDNYHQDVEKAYRLLSMRYPEEAQLLRPFYTAIGQIEVYELEETFTRIFENNAEFALEIGWHLFGESYSRGSFLVKMRAMLDQFNLPESSELPDHIGHVLSILGCLEGEEASAFSKDVLLPAVTKINNGFKDSDSIYKHVLACMLAVIKSIAAVNEENMESK